MRKEKPFHLKNALSLVSIDFHTPLRYLVAGMVWVNVCHASDFKIVVLHLIVLEAPARMMLHIACVMHYLECWTKIRWWFYRGPEGATTPRIVLGPPLFRRVQNFEFPVYYLLKILANEKDVQGMNMIPLNYYCTLAYTKCCSSYLCVFWFCM